MIPFAQYELAARSVWDAGQRYSKDGYVCLAAVDVAAR